MNRIKRQHGNLSIRLILILFVMGAVSLSAKTPYEFSVYGGGGYSTFLYRLPANSTGFTPPPLSGVKPQGMDVIAPPDGLYAIYGVSSSGISGDLGVAFTGFVAPNIGLHVGIGLGLCNISTNVDSLKTYTPECTLEREPHFNVYTALFDYNETHRMFNLSIPLMLQFQTAPDQRSWIRNSDFNHGVYAMLGIKLNVLLSNPYESSVATGYNIAYQYPYDNWGDTQEFAGLGKFKGKSTKGDVGFIQTIFAAELGMKWRVSNKMYLYTGAYLDYGLNDPLKNSRKPTSEYIFEEYLQELSLLDFSDKTNLMTVGLKVRLAFVKAFNPLSCPQF